MPSDVDLSHAAILTMLSIGEIAPSYERELSALEVEIGLLDGTGRRMFGLVQDYVAYGNSQIDGAELRRRMYFENFLP